MKKQLAVMLGATMMVGLLGCQAPAVLKMTPVPAVVLSGEVLQQYDWQLVSVTNKVGKSIKPELFNPANKPLVVSFDKDNVRLKNTCNHMWGGYKVVDAQVLVGDMASTMKACEPSLMAVDRLAPSTLQGAFDIVVSVDKLPMLVVTSKEQISRFQAIAKTAK